MNKYTYLLTLSILSLGILITGCNSTGTNPNPINGTWEAITGNTEGYAQITLPNLDTYYRGEENMSDCYIHVSLKLNKLSNNNYLASNIETGKTDTISLKVENNILITTGVNGNITKFERSNADLSQLNFCNE